MNAKLLIKIIIFFNHCRYNNYFDNWMENESLFAFLPWIKIYELMG